MEKEFVHVFIAEAEEFIETLEKNVLDLEKDIRNKEGINEVFRVMHTLKGAGDMFGFTSIRELTHLLETLYDQIREGMTELDQDLLNLTYRSIDHLRKLLQDKHLQDPQNKANHQELLNKAIQISSLLDNNEIVKNPEKLAQQEKNEGLESFVILFSPDENLLNRGINLFSIFQELSEIGTYTINEIPADNDEDVSKWKIFIDTDKGINSIEDALMFILTDCEISKLTKKNQDPTNPGNLKTEVTHTTNDFILHSEINNQKNDTDLSIEGDVHQDTERPSAPAVESNYNEIGKQVTSRINVEASKLDKLMNLVSELVTTNTQLNLINSHKKYNKLGTIVEKIERLSRLFRDNTLSIRLIPISDLIVRFRRLIRDLSLELQKDIQFITEGMDTELDKNIIDNLAEPLMHILRNAIDHGIETPEERRSKGKPEQGTIKLSAYHTGANVFLEIQDNGKGLNTNKILQKAIENGLIAPDAALSTKEIHDLIFHPGFSTASKITKISGRGIGMDVVKNKISDIQGDISIESEPGLGTLFTIKLHQTISIIDSLMVRIDQSYFLVPISDVEFCIDKKHKELSECHNERVEHNKELIPFINLRQLFNYHNNVPEKEKLIIVSRENEQIGLVADEIIGEHQAVIKPLGTIFHNQDFLIGASIMGDGNFAFMLDINKLIIKNNNKKEAI